jgi:flagellar protein FliS
MNAYRKARNDYGTVELMTGVATANSVQLAQMLFDGLVDSLTVARGHILHGATAEKARALSRASRIVVGLQEGLDFERGGEIAQTLGELYGYVQRRLVHVNANNDVTVLDELHGLMSEIRAAWRTLDPLPGRATLGAMVA